MILILMTISENEKESITPQIDAISRLRYGGFYKPHDCVSKEKTAIIIPYRDRVDHLEKTLNYLHKFLQNQQIQYGIFVVEMVCFSSKYFKYNTPFEPRSEKTGLRGFRPGPTQTGLYSHTRWLEA